MFVSLLAILCHSFRITLSMNKLNLNDLLWYKFNKFPETQQQLFPKTKTTIKLYEEEYIGILFYRGKLHLINVCKYITLGKNLHTQ